MMGHRQVDPSKKAALELLSDTERRKGIVFLLSENASESDADMASVISRTYRCDAATALVIVTCIRDNPMNSGAVLKSLEESCVDKGPYIVNGVVIDQSFRGYLAKAYEIGPKLSVKNSSLKSEIVKEDVIEIFKNCYEVLSMDNPSEKLLQSCVDDLIDMAGMKKGDDKEDITLDSVKGRLRRMTHLVWFRYGYFAECEADPIRQLIAKTINSIKVTPSEFRELEYALESASYFAELISADVEIMDMHVSHAINLYELFTSVYDRYTDDNSAYVSLLFTEDLGYYEMCKIARRFDDIKRIRDELKKEIEKDNDDPNRVILDRPVTERIGNSTVHKGYQDEDDGQGELFNAHEIHSHKRALNTEKEFKELFDEPVVDPDARILPSGTAKRLV
jgi:hypothetical protein